MRCCILLHKVANRSTDIHNHAEWMPDYNNTNSGDDISGIVHEVGENVDEFKVGDRVAAFHEMLQPGGSFAEYAVAWKHTTFFLPKGTSFEGKHVLKQNKPQTQETTD